MLTILGVFLMREKNKNCWGIKLTLGLCLLCVTAFFILPVQADYWAGISDNGQYQVTINTNADGSTTLQGAAVGPGGSIEQLSDCNNNEAVASGEVPADNGVSQDLNLTGPSGWAEVAAKDPSGNQAAAEVEFTTSGLGSVYVRQYANPITNFDAVGTYSVENPAFMPVTGAVAGQKVSSHDFSWIEATTNSINADGSTAEVIAEATSSDIPTKTYQSDRYDSSMFKVYQGAEALTLGTGIEDTYTGYSGGYDKLPTYAYQWGEIKHADTADVSAGSSIPQGFTSLVTGSVNNGNLKFYMDAAAGQSYCGSSYKTTADGKIEANGASGTASAISTGPNGQFASVVTLFNKTCHAKKSIEFDLSASGKLSDDGYSKIKVENEVNKPRGYFGNITAMNSAGESDRYCRC